jgi:hypothetical protein
MNKEEIIELLKEYIHKHSIKLNDGIKYDNFVRTIDLLKILEENNE